MRERGESWAGGGRGWEGRRWGDVEVGGVSSDRLTGAGWFPCLPLCSVLMTCDAHKSVLGNPRSFHKYLKDALGHELLLSPLPHHSLSEVCAFQSLCSEIGRRLETYLSLSQSLLQCKEFYDTHSQSPPEP